MELAGDVTTAISTRAGHVREHRRELRAECRTPEYKAKLRRFKLKLERELLEKTMAIVVALAWSSAFHQAITSALGRVGIAAGVYAVAWLAFFIFAGVLSHIHYEQFTTVMAELVAFLWRDASLGIFNVVWGPEDSPEHGDSGNGTHPELHLPRQLQIAASSLLKVAHEEESWKPEYLWWTLKYFSWAFGTAVVSALIIAIVLNIRKRRPYFATEKGKEIAEAVLDVEVDAIGLAVGYICFAAVCAGIAGPEFRERLENPVHEVRDHFWESRNFQECLVIVAICVACSFAASYMITLEEDQGGLRAEGVRIHVQFSIVGYFLGFMLNRGFSMLCGLANSGEDTYGREEAHLTLTSIFYPFIVMLYGLRMVWRIRQRDMRADSAPASDNLEDVTSRHRRSNQNKIRDLALQTCMALAFEGLIDKVFEAYASEDEEYKFGIAIGLTLIWFIVCGIVSSLQRKAQHHDAEAEGEAEAHNEHLAEAEAHDGAHLAVEETS